jgi:hypothetical protein
MSNLSLPIFSFVFGLLIALFIVFLLGKREFKPDFRTLFILGIIWFPLGMILDNFLFFIIGMAYMVIGLAHKEKWREARPPRGSQKILVSGLLIGTLLVVFLTFILGWLR